MSQDELDELFGEEMSQVSQIEQEEQQEELKISKFTDSEGEAEQNSEIEAQEEEETINTSSSADIPELCLASVEKPSDRGLIVRI